MAYNEELILKDLSSRGESILEAAKNLFLKYGYAQTSLEMIIGEAGGSRRSIYHEFGNKQGLLTSVIQQQVLIHTASVASIELLQLAPRDALREMCFRFVKGIVSDTIVSLYRLVLQVVPKLPEIGVLVYEKGPLKGMKPLTDYLVLLDKENVISIDDPLFATQILMEMVKGRLHFKALLLRNEEITDENIQQQVDKAVDLFLKAYHPDS